MTRWPIPATTPTSLETASDLDELASEDVDPLLVDDEPDD